MTDFRLEYDVGPGSKAQQQVDAYNRRIEARKRREAELQDFHESHCVCGQYIGCDIDGLPYCNYCPRCGEDLMYVPNH